MDAITTKKTTAFALVVLMVGVAFSALAPTASASHLGAGPDVRFDVTASAGNPRPAVTGYPPALDEVDVSIWNGTNINFYNVVVPTTPAGFKLRAATGYDLSFNWIPLTELGGTALNGEQTGAPTYVRLALVNASTGSVLGSLRNYDSTVAGLYRNVTFLVTTQTFEGPGLYSLNGCTSTSSADCAGNVIAEFVVYPRDDVSVSVTPAGPLEYAPGNRVWTINTGVRATLSSNAPGFLENAPITDASGNHLFLNDMSMGAGTWTVWGSVNLNGAEPQCFDATTGDWEAESTECDFAVNDDLSIPERIGNRSFTITPVQLGLTSVATSAFVAFDQTVTYRPTFPGSNRPVLATDFETDEGIDVNRWNFSMLTPTNMLFVDNSSTAITGFDECYNLRIADPTHADWDCFGDVTFPTITVDATTGNIEIMNSSWQSGTYRFTFSLETAGTSTDSPPEYVQSWTLTPSTPASVTLSPSVSQVDVPRANNVAATSNPLTPGTPTEAAVGTVEMTLTISGQSPWEHPLCRVRDFVDAATNLNPLRPLGDGTTDCDPLGATWETGAPAGTWNTLRSRGLLEGNVDYWEDIDADCVTGTPVGAEVNCFVHNITIRGDVLPEWQVLNYDPETGIADLIFTPSRNGTIFVDVKWKGTTTTATIPVINGAQITASVDNITVDQTTTVTATVRNAFGGAVENANVYVFGYVVDEDTGEGQLASFQGTGATFRAGTGASGAGAGGVYSFTLLPTEVQDLVLYAEVCTTGTTFRCNASYAFFSVIPASDLNVEISATEAMAANRTHIELNITNATGVALTGGDTLYSVFFLDEDQTKEFAANGTRGLLGLNPTAVTFDSQNAQMGHVNVSLQAGTYSVYVCSGFTSGNDCLTAKHDNREDMPTLTVHSYNATFTPSNIAAIAALESDVEVNVTVMDWNGQRVNGTLRVRPADMDLLAADPGVVDITDGAGTVTLTGAKVGSLRWQFNPEGAPSDNVDANTVAWGNVNGTLGVSAGNLTITPTTVTIGQTTVVTVTVRTLAGEGLEDIEVALCSRSLHPNFPTGSDATDLDDLADLTDAESCPARDTTSNQGVAGVTVTPTGLQAIRVYLDGTYSGQDILVVAGRLTVAVDPAAPQEGGTATITVSQPGGTAAGGTPVVVTRDGTQILSSSTSSEGEVVLSNLQAGNYTVTATRTGFLNGTASFSIGRNVTPPAQGARFELANLQVPTTGSVGQAMTVTADIRNTGSADGTATVLLLVNGAVRDSRSIPVSAGGNETVGFDFTPTQSGAFRITVRLASGETLAERTVNIATQQTTTTTTTTTVTSPPTTTTTATPPTPTPRVPGFEVVALLGALAVAMLVLRRRS